MASHIFKNPSLGGTSRLIAVSVICAAGLAACGGGNSSSTTVPGNEKVALGHYTTNCVKRAGGGSVYKMVSVNLEDAGSGKTRALVSYAEYGDNATCHGDARTKDVAATFELTPLAMTKTIVPSFGHVTGGTASVAEARLESIRLSKGSFTNIPLSGTATKVGYIVKGADLMLVAGSRDADGVGSYFSDLVLKKLP